MPRSHGVISIRGDIKRAYDYDKESNETTDRLTASAELQELKKVLAMSPLDSIMPEAKTSKMSISPDDSLNKTVPLSMEKPSKVAHVGNNLDPK
jgi:hypothetical protein